MNQRTPFSETENFNSGTQSAIAAGAALATLAAAGMGEVPSVVLPPGYSHKLHEELLPAPVRKRGKVNLFDVQSFIAVVKEQKQDATHIYSKTNPPQFLAVFNDIAGEPGHGDHTARYDAPLSVEWKAWTELDSKPMTQVNFAQFIENNLLDVVEPAGAALLEIARTLEAKKDVKFASSIRLSDGANEFTYNEEIQGSAAKGTMTIPEQFVIGIPVFELGEKWRVDVRLRYRISEGKLALWYELIRPHKVIDQAVAEVRTRIATETEVAVLNGMPAA